jgi:acyl-CoA synthetase (NDP forming)
LRPRSIALLGGRPAAEAIRQLDRIGFDGQVWPIHPSHDRIEGRQAFRSIADLPTPPDAAFLAVNRHLTVESVAALAHRGAGGAVAYASGFSEAGTGGVDLQTRLAAAAGAMAVLGPNCYGFINYLDGVLLWPDQHGGRRVARGVAIITQSGNIGLNLTMQRRGLPIGYLVTLGNQAAIGVSDMIEALLDDTRVTAIGLHIEGIDDPVAFARAAGLARQRGVPVVALKAGRSAAGAKLTVSHTASLAGADDVVDAFLRRVGVVRVHSIPVLLESLKILHLFGPLAGRDIASMSCSGGEAALIADAVAGSALNCRPLDAAQTARVAATLPALVTISNPLDYHTFSWGDEAALTGTFAAMMAAGYDLTMLILDFPRRDRCADQDWDTSVRAIIAAVARTGTRAAVVASLPEALPEARAEALMAAGVVPLCGLDEALAAIEAAAAAGELARRPERVFITAPPIANGVPTTLSEWQAKRALAARGLAVPEGRLVASPEQAAATAAGLGFPVVVKAAGSHIAHKTEMGAVKLDLRDRAAVAAAVAELQGMSDALLVERMVTDTVAELIVGVARDPLFGPYLVIGSGGMLTELVGDTRLLLIPAAAEEITTAIRSLKVAKLLDGYRGRPRGDLAAAVDAVLAIQAFAMDHGALLLELDVNPLMVRPAGQGAVAADALIRLVKQTSAA